MLPSALKPTLPRPSYPVMSEKVAPPERRLAKPRQMYMVPRVVIKGATFSLVIIRPLIAPIRQPTISIRITITGTLK